MSADVHEWADQLRQHACHFEEPDWEYTRDLGGITAIRTDRPEDQLLGRMRASLRHLFRRKDELDRIIPVGRFSMARYALKRDTNLPDGIVRGGSIITYWEEHGEYLQYVQPSVGALVADLMDAHPDLPEVVALAVEMKRINDGYAARLAGGAA